MTMQNFVQQGFMRPVYANLHLLFLFLNKITDKKWRLHAFWEVAVSTKYPGHCQNKV